MQNIKEKWSYLVYGTVIMLVSLIIGIFLSKVFSKDEYLRKIYTYSFAVANFSFMGNAVVLAIFPNLQVITTNGSEISEETLDMIEELSKSNKIILLM